MTNRRIDGLTPISVYMQSESIDKTRENAKAYFLGLVKDDFTQLGYLTGFLRSQLPDEAPNNILLLTQSIVRELMEFDGVYVVDTRTEHRDPISSREVMKNIEEVFRQTSGSPDVGDGIWFGMD